MKLEKLHILSISLILIIGYTVFHAGIYSGFLLDDYPNLTLLGWINQHPTWPVYWNYISSSSSGMLGRPIAMASFALQAEYWPLHPDVFKLTNLIIHLFNGLLIYLISLLILSIRQIPPINRMVLASLITLIWLITPQHTSSIFYVVQRMALLSASFTLIGLVMYLHARQRLQQQESRRDYLYLLLAFSIPLSLGIFTKENAILFPLLILALEVTLLASMTQPRHWKMFRFVFIYLPSIGILGYLIYLYPQQLEGFKLEGELTPLTRVLTETRILFYYIYQLLVPNPEQHTLFYHSVISSDLFTPITTLISTVAWISLMAFSLFFRHKQPFLAFAILWFIASHLLESSIINLDLYYEHRNYLASFGIFFGIILFLWQSLNVRSSKMPAILITVALLFAGISGFNSVQLSHIWANPIQQAIIWVKQSPDSIEAHQHFAQVLDMHKKYPEAYQQNLRSFERFPNQLNFFMSSLTNQCHFKQPSLPTLNAAFAERIQQDDNLFQSSLVFNKIRKLKELNLCPSLSYEFLHRLSQFLSEQTKKHIKAGQYAHLAYVKQEYFYYLQEEKYPLAHDIIQHIQEQQPSLDNALSLVSISLKMQQPILAKQYFTDIPAACEKKPKDCALLTSVIQDFEQQINRLEALE